MKKVFYFAGSMMAGTLIACSGGNQKRLQKDRLLNKQVMKWQFLIPLP